MRRYTFATLIMLFFAIHSLAQSNINSEAVEVPTYKLYPTENMWNFLKLDTRTGRIWQVQFSVDGDKSRFEVVLNDRDLIWDGKYFINGRFELYPTKNMYNFILLDRITGDTYQVQWSLKEKNRAVFAIPLSY